MLNQAVIIIGFLRQLVNWLSDHVNDKKIIIIPRCNCESKSTVKIFNLSCFLKNALTDGQVSIYNVNCVWRAIFLPQVVVEKILQTWFLSLKRQLFFGWL